MLYFGNVLGYNSIDRFSKLSRAWLDSAGVSADVDHGLKWTCASGGVSHLLLSYTLLDRPLNPKAARSEDIVPLGTLPEKETEADGQGEREVMDVQGKKSLSSRPSKVFALGRNTHAQLGLGFSSQEATRGMVTGQLTGQGGVKSVVAGGTFSLVVTEGGQGSSVWVFGNDTLGQIGSSPSSSPPTTNQLDPYDISTRLNDSDTPQLKLLPLPKSVELGGGEGWTVKSSAAGVDHTLLLLEREVNGCVVQQVVATGLNTDGQLGLTPDGKKDAVPIEPLLSRTFQPVPLPLTPIPSSTSAGTTSAGEKIVQVECAADTSYALTSMGNIFSWGNSEYGQSFSTIQDRITSPIHIPNPLPAAYASYRIPRTLSPPKPVKLVAGGSFAALLDTQNRAWIVGHHPTTTTTSDQPNPTLTLIPNLPRIQNIFSGLEYLLLTTPSSIYILGLPPTSTSTTSSSPSTPFLTPTKIPFSIPKAPRQTWLDHNPHLKMKKPTQQKGGGVGGGVRVEAAACTRDHVVIVLDDGQGDEVWGECDRVPRDKGTDVTM